MKKTLFFIACFAFLISFGFSYTEGDYSSYAFARLSYVKGDVFIERPGDLGFEEGVVNLPLTEGDKLGTRDGRAEIHFGKGNYLRIDSQTQIDFANLPRDEDKRVKLHLLSGHIYLRIDFLEEEKIFEIHTPDASFYILEQGLYRFDVRDNRETELFVFEGAVEAAAEEGSLEAGSEEKLVASNGKFLSEPERFYESLDDEFSQWNESRDSLHRRTLSRRYLPSELDEYETELADNGRWVYEQPYGYVWCPYVYDLDWRPYYYGRWVWYPLAGWTWVSYEPWGWSVYHYGRWHWRLGLGWYWIPHTIWGPAWVNWYWGYDYIGWCPLSYYGYPVVIINNNFYGYYYGRDYPANSRALVVVRKDQLQSPNISKAALSQDKVLRIGKISLSSKQPDYHPVLKRVGIENLKAAQVLSRSELRSVSKNYGSGKVLSPSGSRSLPSKRFSGDIRTRDSAMTRSPLDTTRRISNSAISSRSGARDVSRQILRKSEVTGRNSANLERNRSSSPTIRTFPSRLSRPSSRSNPIPSSPSRQENSLSPRVRRERSDSPSSRTFSSRSEVRSYPERTSPSRSSSSRFPSLRKNENSYSTSSTRLNITRPNFPSRTNTFRNSFSSPSYHSSPSRSISSRSSNFSSTRMNFSPSPRSSSSGFGVSRSSSHGSSSGRNIKKR